MKMSVNEVKGLTKFYQSKGAVATNLIFLYRLFLMNSDCTYIVRSGTIENSTIGATPNERNQGQVDCTRHIVRYGSGRNY